ncbi:hypothetical protein OAM75_04450 [Gammaproteobacteria bacterium]|nr:hypothetical protein [Gammaproteobacteria bacterium]
MSIDYSSDLKTISFSIRDRLQLNKIAASLRRKNLKDDTFSAGGNPSHNALNEHVKHPKAAPIIKAK